MTKTEIPCSCGCGKMLMRKRSGEYQIVTGWCGFSFYRPVGAWHLIYLWILRLGFVEIRKWNNRRIRIVMEDTVGGKIP